MIGIIKQLNFSILKLKNKIQNFDFNKINLTLKKNGKLIYFILLNN